MGLAGAAGGKWLKVKGAGKSEEKTPERKSASEVGEVAWRGISRKWMESGSDVSHGEHLICMIIYAKLDFFFKLL